MEMQAQHHLEILLEFGKVINRTKPLNALLESVANFARDLTDADRCSIFIYDKQNDMLSSKVAHNVHPITIPAQKGVAGVAARSRETQIVVEAYKDYRFNPEVDRVTGYTTHTILAVPLLNNKEETIGVFQALNKKKGIFTNTDAELLLLISNYAASAIENALLYDKIRSTQTKIIQKLASAAEFKDQETSKHTKRVGLYSALLGRAYGLNEEDVHKLELTAPMHDAGKIGIADSIILKPEKLNPEEFEIIKTHARIGYQLLYDNEDEYLKMAALIALEHHEKYNGKGYPVGKKGDEISIYGRIVAIADVFDALTSSRPYKDAWSFNDAIEYLKKERSHHFDPRLIDLFFEHLETVHAIYDELKD